MTPLIKLDSVFFKREDLNTTGSAKDRAILVQTNELIKKGINKAVISSTGNAAISAAYFCHQNNIHLTVFLSPKINQNKLNILKANNVEIKLSSKPISDAFKYSKNTNSFFLRQSTDPNALIGYQSIGKEITQQLPKVTSVFIPVGSGTTLIGISQILPKNVKIFAIQPASNCPIAKLFDPHFSPEDKSVTDALTVKLLPLKSKIIKTIKNSQGNGLVIQNSDIIKANDYLLQNNICTSNEGSLALAGYYKAVKNKIDIGLNPVVILTGVKR